MSRLSHIAIHTLCLAICMAGARMLYLRSAEHAWPDPTAVRIDSVGISGQCLSLLILLEGTPVTMWSAMRRESLRRSSGIVFIALCTLYMYTYLILKVSVAGLDWQANGILRGAGLEPLGAIAYDLVVSWSDDWAQLACLSIPAIFVVRTLPASTAGKVDFLELLGRVCLVLLPLFAIVHQVYRPWGLH